MRGSHNVSVTSGSGSISLTSDIADFCAREEGSIVPDEKRRIVAFEALAKDIMDRQFEISGRSQILFLNYSTKKARLTREDLMDIIEFNYDGDHGRSGYLPYCWAPSGIIERWFEKHRLPKPSGWFKAQHGETAQVESAQSNAQTLQPSAQPGTPAEQPTVLFKMSSTGGKKSGIVRRANRAWTPHASDLAIQAHRCNQDYSNEKIALAISDYWKLLEPKCPGYGLYRSLLQN